MSVFFFDTSAVVPLFVEEPHTAAAQEAWRQAREVYAWSWMRVEAEAGLIRRRVNPRAWREWHAWMPSVAWLDMEPRELDSLCAFNRSLGLRAADAGHLYVCERAGRILPDLQIVTFDREMRRQARRLGLAVWSAARAGGIK